MKKYTEKEGFDVFDWNKALDNKINGVNDGISYHLLWDRASAWVTCAVGNQCDIIPRNPNGGPKDQILFDLGVRFFDAIDSDDYKKAQRILTLIECRSSYLIEKLEKSNPKLKG